MDIEKVALEDPKKINTVKIDFTTEDQVRLKSIKLFQYLI